MGKRTFKIGKVFVGYCNGGCMLLPLPKTDRKQHRLNNLKKKTTSFAVAKDPGSVPLSHL